jgi:hypothetical protein
MRALAALVSLGLLGCACDGPPAADGATRGEEVFVASEADFVDFDRWERFDRGARGFLPSHPDGATYVYLNRRPPADAVRHPTGTVIVRVTQGGPTSDWEVHAMVKRGGGYNAGGAAGWEYFDLTMERTGERLTPRIHWRGEGPVNGDGYAHGAEGVALGCNHCHGAVPEHDGVIGDELRLPMP